MSLNSRKSPPNEKLSTLRFFAAAHSKLLHKNRVRKCRNERKGKNYDDETQDQDQENE